jgi:hypothetical protein
MTQSDRRKEKKKGEEERKEGEKEGERERGSLPAASASACSVFLFVASCRSSALYSSRSVAITFLCRCLCDSNTLFFSAICCSMRDKLSSSEHAEMNNNNNKKHAKKRPTNFRNI